MILPPPPAFCRSRMNSRQQKKRAVEVCLQDAVELLGPHVEDRCTATPDAGVVDQDIWRAKGPRDDIEQGEDAPLISDIDLQGHRLPPHRLDTAAAFLGALLVSVKRDSDISPSAGEFVGHGLADTRVGASDEGDSVGKPGHFKDIKARRATWSKATGWARKGLPVRTKGAAAGSATTKKAAQSRAWHARQLAGTGAYVCCNRRMTSPSVV
jgi:hypothetical protein